MQERKLTINDLKKPTSARKIEFWKSKFKMSIDYIFGSQTAENIDYEDLAFQFSNRTGRPRQIVQKEGGAVLFSFRPNGSIAPTILGAMLLWKWGHFRKKVGVKSRPGWVVTVIDEVTEVVAQGKTVFCKHVFHCDDSL